jgi:uncharacterized protein involved in copper resistance
MFGFGVLVALGALAGAVVVTATVVRRHRRHRRHRREVAMAATAELLFADGTDETAGTTVWGGGEWPRIVVRSHGRLRDVSSSPRRVEVVVVPSPSPWEPPRAS